MLRITSAPLTEVGLAAIAKLPLKALDVGGMPVTAAGLRALAQASTIDDLRLSHCEIADADYVELGAAKHLKRLQLQTSNVSAETLAKLRKRLAELRD